MTTARLDFATALSPGARIVPVILVAGVPVVLVPAGLAPTTVAVTAGTVDALWWPGTGTLTETLPDASTFDPVEDLLDPGEVFEVFERASALKGDVRVEALTFSVLDTDGRGTALLSIREARTAQLLASAITATSTSVPLVASGGFPASGIAAIGRETFLYSSISTDTLVTSLVTRGRYGSQARAHDAPAEHPPLVCAGGPRHWQSRLCTLWLCALSDDGATLTDPTLMFAGTVGAGVQLKGNLTRWSVPVDHITESLDRKIDTPPLDLYGYSHYATDPGVHPLVVNSATFAAAPIDGLALQWSTTDANDNEGWHPSAESFIAAADAVFSAGTTGAGRVLLVDGKAVVRVQGSNASPRWFSARAAWDTVVMRDHRVDDDNTPASWVSAARAPEACFRLDGWVKVPSALDFARIGSTLAWTYTTADGSFGGAALSLVAKTRGVDEAVVTILERDAGRQAIRVLPARPGDLLCVARTPAKLGIIARGASPIAALRAGALGIDALTGQDLFESCVDWDHMERAFTSAPTGGLPQAREYRFVSGSDTFLAVLIDELRLRGMCLALRFGRITGVRLQSLADTEGVVADIGELDLLTEAGDEIPLEVIDSTEPLATGVAFHILSGTDKPSVVTVTDATFQSEFGDGEVVECKALLALPPSLAPAIADTLGALYAIAQQTLGPLAEPSRSIRLPLSPRLMGLQPGDLVGFTHSRIPTWEGTRGVVDAVCQVQEVRRQLFGGRFRATASIRLQSSASAGYCPEVMLAAGGVSDTSPTVTIDVTTGWGAQCHAQNRTAAGELSTDALAGLAIGDAVVLSALDDRTPIADEKFAVIAMTSTTVTLSGNPSTAMETAAVGQYGVALRWGEYDDATSAQHAAFAWIADASGGIPATGDPGRRWAA